MAKLPYKITICPDEPNPKQFTAMTPQLVNALRFGYDMTINQNQYIWPAGSKGATQINTHEEKTLAIQEKDMSTQPEALRLADSLEAYEKNPVHLMKAAAELRRLHEVNAELLATLDKLARLGNGDRYGNSIGNTIAQEAIAKATGEQQ